MRMMRGFTLIETIMVIAVTSIVAMLVAPLLGIAVEAMSLHLDRTELEETGNIALARMTREIRRLRDDESVVTAAGDEFEFLDLENNRIRYRQQGNNLVRSVNGGSDYIMTGKVQSGSLQFTYFNESGTELASPQTGLGTATDICRLEIRMTLAANDQAYPVFTGVRPRNLRHVSYLFP